MIGELCIGGDGLADGYQGRPDLSAARLIAHPLRPGARLYRTGDLARWRDDGVIDFVGRMDRQVKIRGFRVELGEVESTLKHHPDVQEAVVLVQNAEAGDRRLDAYVVPRPGAGSPAFPTILRDFLRAVLPNYMVPAGICLLDRFPLTPNGKVDTNALPAIADTEAKGAARHAARASAALALAGLARPQRHRAR